MNTELQVIERAELALGFATRKAELAELAKQSARITGITNAAGYNECHAARMLLKNTRVEIQKTGKDARDDATKFSKAVIGKEGELIAIISPEETRLNALQVAYDQALADAKRAEEEAEAARIAAIQEHVDDIRGIPLKLVGKSAEYIAREIIDLQALLIDEERFAEFIESARLAQSTAIARLEQMHTDQLAHEAAQAKLIADQAELAQLRKEQDERLASARKKADEERAEADRLAKIERDRLAAEAEAQRQRDAAAEATRRAVQEKADREARAEADRVREDEDKRLAAQREAQKVEQARLEAQAEEVRLARNEALKKSEAARVASLTLGAAVAALIEWFDEYGAQDDMGIVPKKLFSDLKIAVANDVKPARVKKQAAA